MKNECYGGIHGPEAGCMDPLHSYSIIWTPNPYRIHFIEYINVVVPSCWQVNYNAKEILDALSNMI